MTQTPNLRALLDRPGAVVAPGVYDALSALLAAQAGFEALYLSGASISYTRLGRPDIGLVGMSEVAETVALIRGRVDLPLMVDADTGYGNALNVARTVRTFERAGASAIQLEDQVLPKRCGHMAGKRLVATGEMVGKLEAALEARASDDTLIVARTDGFAVEGFEAGLARAEAYLAAGADVLFIEAPQSPDQLRSIGEQFGGRTVLMANMVEGGRTPLMEAERLAELGFGFVIFPGGLIRALVSAGQDYLASLKAHGTTAPFRDRMLDFDSLNTVLGLDEVLAAGARYEHGDD